ncbi:MAG: GTPase [Nanoarchaeota archaeon]
MAGEDRGGGIRPGIRRKMTPLYRILNNSDYLLEIADARYPDWSRHRKLEQQISGQGKGLTIIFNKSDLVDSEELKRLEYRFKDAIFVSARTRQGFSQLRRFIRSLSKKKEITIGVFGYPNTGKSSIINMLKGSHSAGTSSRAGFTKGVQKLRINPKVMMWDSPGVAPFKESESRLALLGAKNPEFLKNVENVAQVIIGTIKKEYPGAISRRYNLDESKKPEEILEGVARRIGALSKGGIPDIERAARAVINDWQKDRLKQVN